MTNSLSLTSCTSPVFAPPNTSSCLKHVKMCPPIKYGSRAGASRPHVRGRRTQVDCLASLAKLCHSIEVDCLASLAKSHIRNYCILKGTLQFPCENHMIRLVGMGHCIVWQVWGWCFYLWAMVQETRLSMLRSLITSTTFLSRWTELRCRLHNGVSWLSKVTGSAPQSRYARYRGFEMRRERRS